MKYRRTQFGAVVTMLASVVVAGAWQQSARPTAVIRYTPPTSLPDTGHAGYCWVGSIAAAYRIDAWRCMEGNSIHDPCFALPDQKAVVCDANPAKDEAGFKLHLTKPLPKSEVHPVPSNHPRPWLIEL